MGGHGSWESVELVRRGGVEKGAIQFPSDQILYFCFLEVCAACCSSFAVVALGGLLPCCEAVRNRGVAEVVEGEEVGFGGGELGE